MQRIVLSYGKDKSAGALSHSDLRAAMHGAAVAAGLPLCEDRRALIMGPPLPPSATGESEQCVLGLDTPGEPSEIRDRLNEHLPDGIRIVRAWSAIPGSPDENPGTFDAAVYDVCWQDALSLAALGVSLRQFLAAREVRYRREREKKVQQIDARSLVHDVTLTEARAGQYRFRLVLAVGSQGSLRPEELLEILGCTPAEAPHVHRLGLLRTYRRRPPWRVSERPGRWE